jgi:hypothetical protein
MPTSKYKIGRTVFIRPARHENLPGGAYMITQKLRERYGEFEYRVRNIAEPHERVVRNSATLRNGRPPTGDMAPQRAFVIASVEIS